MCHSQILHICSPDVTLHEESPLQTPDLDMIHSHLDHQLQKEVGFYAVTYYTNTVCNLK